MADDPLEQVLRLVAEGRLTAEEAAPILAALEPVPARPGPGRTRSDAAPAPESEGGPRGRRPVDDPATALRIEVVEAGRAVVNLRLPIGVGRFALDRVPGLSGDQVDRVREALRSGLNGPVLEVADGDDGVRIVLE
jgi:hypothetical protein